MRVPSELRRALKDHWGDAGQRWFATLPAVLNAAEERWGITIGAPFEPGGFTSWAAPATSADGRDCVYKCVIPHAEAVGEALALAAYDGDGAVHVLASRPETYEILIERCAPGVDLWSIRDDAQRLDIATGLMRRLWRPSDAEGMAALATVGPMWADVTERRLLSLDLPWTADPIERGVALLRSLPLASEPTVLLHGDLHPGNILSADREPWLTIDPKPMVGEAAYDPVQLVVQKAGRVAEPPPLAEVELRLADIASRLDLDVQRVGLWGIARAAEWSMWSLEHGAVVEAAIEYSWARSLDSIFSDGGTNGATSLS